MRNKTRILKWFLWAWLLVLMLLIHGVAWGQVADNIPRTVVGDNLVINGDFEQGETGFITGSSYTYVSGYIDGNGEYSIDNDVANHYNNQGSSVSMSGQGHSGKYMMVNGSGIVDDFVWQETINVTPNTTFLFSVWVAHLWKAYTDSYKAWLKFYINGEPLNDEPFINSCSNNNQRPNWEEFSVMWNSGNSTTATITIYDTNPNNESGNDFGLDDISFRGELCLGPISRLTPVCAGTSLELTPPELYCEGCSGQWEILQGDNIIYTSVFNTISNVPFGWNGCFIRYAVNCQGVWQYSNAVQIFVTDGFDVSIQTDGPTTICEGDTVFLHANVVNDVMYDFIAVGDIICTDGSIVHPDNWASSGKNAKGVVFYVDSTEVHGWALGLTEMSTVKWSNSTGNIPGLENYAANRDAILDFQGKENTEIINTEQYPAAWYCLQNGGYLPSMGQLNILFGGLAVVNESLTMVGGTPFVTTGNGWYLLSSTVQSTSNVYYIDRSGAVQSGSKTYPGIANVAVRTARPVFDF